jgi:hypothetical protein
MAPIKPPPGYTLDAAGATPATPPGYTLDVPPADETAPPDDRNTLQRAFDDFRSAPTTGNRWDFGMGGGGTQRLAQGAADTLAPLVHPFETLKSAWAGAHKQPSFLSMALGPGYDTGKQLTHAFAEDPVRAAGALGAGVLEGEGAGALLGRVAPTLSATRSLAMGDPNVAALKTLRIPAGSTDAVRTLQSVEGARPFLQGTKSIADAQTRIPAAKAEIWAPYQEALDRVGARPVRGPDGMTTVGDLEAQRSQLSAINRGLKTGDPASLKLAEQKGMSQAQLLERQRAFENALDPELVNAGIRPREIRKAFGQVSQVGSRVLGRSTLTENAPSGFGRMMNFKLNKPGSWFGETAQGARDLLAGRPGWTAKPSDVGMSEAFRMGGPKPDFGRVNPLSRFQLPASATIREGEEPFGDWQFGVPNEPQVTPLSRAFEALPARAGEGTPEPMLWNRAPSHPGAAEGFGRTRIQPSTFARPEIIPPRARIAGTEGIRNVPRGLLPEPANEPLQRVETGSPRRKSPMRLRPPV